MKLMIALAIFASVGAGVLIALAIIFYAAVNAVGLI